jgi:hypothetical protein
MIWLVITPYSYPSRVVNAPNACPAFFEQACNASVNLVMPAEMLRYTQHD